MNKVDGDSKELTGAEFELYKDVDGTKTKINLVAAYDTDNTTVLYYRPATTAEASVAGFESAVIEAGKIAIKGLDDDTYYLRETKAPEGYNLLTEDVKIVISCASAPSVPDESVLIMAAAKETLNKSPAVSAAGLFRP